MAKHTTRNVDLDENTAFQDNMAKTISLIVPEGYVEERISFPPYWKPELAQGFRGTVLYRDERDKNFHRYVIESSVTLDCREGPVDDGVIVTVQPGEKFSMGCYAALPLERFFGLELAVIVRGSRKLPANEASEGKPRDLWEFKTLVSPQVKQLLESRRSEDMAFLKEAQRIAGKKMMEELARSSVSARAVSL